MASPSRVSPWLLAVMRPLHRLFMPLYFQVAVRHADRIPATGPVILAPTHRSRWDTFALYCATGRTLRFMASQDEFVGLQGWFMRRLGAFAVNTRRPGPDALRHCRELLLDGQALVIFPEGTIYYYAPHEVHPLKPGVAWLALDCQRRLPEVSIPIIPVRLVYGDRYLRFRSRIEVVVMDPIPVRAFADLGEKEGIRALSAAMQTALGDVVNTSTHERIADRVPAEPAPPPPA